MKLFSRKYGNNGNTIIIVHGLYGASDNWISVAKALSDTYQVYLIDQRNHGQSPHAEEMNYQVMADDLFNFIQQEKLNKAILIGHSMGGKTVMNFALQNPTLIDKLIVLDISPKSYDSFSNFAKITNDHRAIIDGLLSIQPSTLNSRIEIDQALASSIPNKNIRAFLLKNITRNAQKEFCWKLNLSVLSENLPRIMEAISKPESTIDFPEHKPVILIRGVNSPYVQDDDMQYVRDLFPGAQMASIPNAGHWLHVEQPELFLKTLRYFMD